MKYAALVATLVALVVLGFVAREVPKIRYAFVFLLGFIPFTELVWRMSAMLAESKWYRGDAQGIDVTIIDLLALGLAVSLPRSSYPMAYRFTHLLYLYASSLSLLVAWKPAYAAFSLWRIVRAMFLGTVVARATSEDEKLPPVLLAGYACGLVAEFLEVLYGRYVLGYYQTSGTFAHQNSLGMAVNIVTPMFFAVLLSRPKYEKLAAIAVVAGMGCVVMSLSRGALTMLGLSLVLVYVGSLVRKVTKRKIWIGVAGIALTGAVAIKSADTIIARFTGAPSESARGRVLFENAAKAMLDDQFTGVGLNNYSYVMVAGQYGRDAGLRGYDVNGIVHNIYWLTASELGYLGIIAYLLLIAVPMLLALDGIRRSGSDVRGDVLLGCFAGLLVTHLQGLLEWVARQTTMSYLIWMQAALILALWRQIRESNHRLALAKAP